MYSNFYENIRRMFWDGTQTDKNGVTVVYKLDEYGIKHSIWRALRDYTARTEEKKEGDSSASADKMICAMPKFIARMNEYFGMKEPYTTATEYDTWHNQMCELFMSEMQEHKIRAEVKYGKAQKIVNMSMKTIFCLNGADQKAEEGYFDFCHMPLDSITINWFREYVAERWFNLHKKRNERIKISLEGGPLPKWSSLTFAAADTYANYCNKINQYSKQTPYDYMFFVTMIREYFKQPSTINFYDGLTPFEAEFYIWAEMQYEMAAETLLKQDLIEKLQSNVDISVNNARIKSLNKKIGQLLLDLSEFY